VTAILLLFLGFSAGWLWPETKGVESGKRYDRLVIRGATLIDGKGTPARGPLDVIIEGTTIQSVRGTSAKDDVYEKEAHVLDARGMHLLPGLINLHAHLQDSRAGMGMPFEYSYKIWLGCGITTIRDVGSAFAKTAEERRKSQEGLIVAPRIFIYTPVGGRTPEEARLSVQEAKKKGADGIKIFGTDRDILAAILAEARTQGLRSAIHIGVEEIDAWDAAEGGVTSIEHWYGVPDAALEGSQNFPPSYNYDNESDRFRYAGRLWREANPEKLKKVLATLVEKGVAWCPTLVIYEANRDLLRAMGQPWFKDFLHPALEEYYKPNPAYHGSYFWNWSTTDEIFWRENYQLWMAAVREFARMGGVVGVGEDAGFIYMLYAFSLLRELELQQEAGFHPIDVVLNATGNNAKILGMENKLGRIRGGFLADLVLLNENPLENFKYLYPTGVMDLKEGKLISRGGIQWTIKDGIIYNAPALLEDVKKIVRKAREEQKGPTSGDR
jgi:imidazolonepropionase-like amidohydrolase